MILTCPKCTARYALPDDAIGPTGRQVRCAKCRHDWHQAPAPQTVMKPPPPVPENADPVFSNFDARVKAHTASTKNETQAASAANANLPVVAQKRRLLKPIAASIAFAGLLAVTGFVGVSNSDALADKSPFLAGMITKLNIDVSPTCTQLGFVDDKLRAEEGRDGLQVMINVTGEVMNVGEAECTLPDISISLKNADGRILNSWLVDMQDVKIQPDQIISFESAAPAPQETATDIMTEFRRIR